MPVYFFSAYLFKARVKMYFSIHDKV